uniref:Uncharacterized protein n=1 Tax=Anguilla anguilla TaxID=7936 RepID=A0A0E9PKI7_ANGAN
MRKKEYSFQGFWGVGRAIKRKACQECSSSSEVCQSETDCLGLRTVSNLESGITTVNSQNDTGTFLTYR